MTTEEIYDWIELNGKRLVGRLASDFGNDLSEDALQEVRLKVTAMPEVIGNAANREAYISRMMYNWCVDIKRKRRKMAKQKWETTN